MDPVAGRRWLPRGDFPEGPRVAALAGELQIPALLARVLLGRGLQGAEAAAFLTGRLADLPDPLLLPDMERAAGRVAAALQSGETVAVHGDYDVDGITGTTLLVDGLRACGGHVDYHIPLRLRDGYGLSAAALESAAAAGIRLVISVDCGVSAHAEAALARQLGIDLIITDHHQPPPRLPDAFACSGQQPTVSRRPHDLHDAINSFSTGGISRTARSRGVCPARSCHTSRRVRDRRECGPVCLTLPGAQTSMAS